MTQEFDEKITKESEPQLDPNQPSEALLKAREEKELAQLLRETEAIKAGFMSGTDYQQAVDSLRLAQEQTREKEFHLIEKETEFARVETNLRLKCDQKAQEWEQRELEIRQEQAVAARNNALFMQNIDHLALLIYNDGVMPRAKRDVLIEHIERILEAVDLEPEFDDDGDYIPEGHRI